MVNVDALVFNAATFVAAVFLLEYGSDKFVDHTAAVSKRLGVSQAAIALLTAGAEWEELGVIVASLARARSSLALGNLVGSCISNILGAFSLGLLIHPNHGAIAFDRSSRLYSVILLLLTTAIIPPLYVENDLVWAVVGALLLSIFVAYVASVAWAISHGSITAPELSDDEDSGDETSTAASLTYSSGSETLRGPLEESDFGAPAGFDGEPTAETPLLQPRGPMHHRGVAYHATHLFVGFLAICLASYILSHAASTITAELGVSDVLFGVVVMAIATTLPEKFIAVFSGSRGHSGILVANTVGSNIFLLSLCLGVIMVGTHGNFDQGNVNNVELAVMWASTLALTVAVWAGGKAVRAMGAVMLLCYVAFLVAEFALIRRP